MTSLSRRRLVQGAGAVGLGLLAGCGRLPWQAPSSARVYRIGRFWEQGLEVLATPNAQALEQGLRDLGYVEGRDFYWEYAFAEGHYERLPELAASLVERHVDIIVIVGHRAALAARDATSTIPIVMAISGDPVASGVVASLARPGGNVTGMSSMSPQLSGKRLELLRDALPGIGRVAVLWNADDPVKALDYQETEHAAVLLGLTLQPLPVRTAGEFASAVEAARHSQADALLALGDTLTVVNLARLVDLATASNLPLMHEPRQAAMAGALLSYGPNLPSIFHRSATYIDKVLKGAKPADLPVEQPTRFDLVINLRTAQALGLTIPPHVLLQATEVVQ